MLSFVYNIQNGKGSFNPHDYRYFEYCFTCPFIVLDVCYAVEIPHKVRAPCLSVCTPVWTYVLTCVRVCTCVRLQRTAPIGFIRIAVVGMF